MREVGVEGRWRPLGRGRVGDAVSGGRRRHEGAPEGWSAGGPSPPETGAAPLRKTRIWGKIFKRNRRGFGRPLGPQKLRREIGSGRRPRVGDG